MLSCWVKSSKKSKSSREIIVDWHKKYIRRGAPQEGCNDITLEKGTQDGTVSQHQSPPSNRQVSQCRNSGEGPRAQALPLPCNQFTSTCVSNPDNMESTEASLSRGFKNTAMLPIHKPESLKLHKHLEDRDNTLAHVSDSSDSFSDTDDPSGSRPLSSQTSDCERGMKSTAASSPRVRHLEDSLSSNKKNSRETLTAPTSILSQDETVTSSCKQVPINSHVSHSQISHKDVLQSAPDSSMSSPSTVSSMEPLIITSLCLGKQYLESLIRSGHCSSPGSGCKSITGDMPFQFLSPQSRCSPEYSPLPSPRMRNSRPSSSMHSGAVTPLHPRVGGSSTVAPTAWLGDGKQHAHRLPLPPLKVPNPYPFSSSSARTSPRNHLGSPSSPAFCWKKGQLLGTGSFGEVYLGFNSETGEMCAMKEVTLSSDDERSKERVHHLRQEIFLLNRLNHPNVVRYYGSEYLDDKLCIYLEYVSGGSVNKILQAYGPLGEIAIQSYTQQILSGLAYLHSQNTLHRDIKGANILVDPNGCVKLADFGLAKHIEGQSQPLSLKGSPYWMAPEVIGNSRNCGLAVDIWSLGCTVMEMAIGKPPWSQYEGVAAMFKILNTKELPPIPDHLSSDGRDFVLKCLQRNPSQRPTVDELLEHPFIKRSASSERCVSSVESIKSTSLATLLMRAPGLEHSDTTLHLDSSGALNQSSTLKAGRGFSDACKTRNVSCHVSELGTPPWSSQSLQNVTNGISPMLSPRASGSWLQGNVNESFLSMLTPQPISGSLSPQNVDGRVSPTLSPRPVHDFSTPSGSGSGTSSIQYQSQLNNNLPEHVGTAGSNVFGGIVQAHLSPETVSQKSYLSGHNVQRYVSRGQKEQHDNEHQVLAGHVSQQLLLNPPSLEPVLEFSSKPSNPLAQ